MKSHSLLARVVLRHSAIVLGFLLTLAPPARAQTPGTLEDYDPNVGGAWVFATAVQPDGKMIIGGLFNTVGGVAHANIARLHADGSVDASFTASTNSNVTSVAVQGDGKIVLGGDFTTVNGTGLNRIARLNADGSLDTSFNPGTGVNGSVFSLAVQADRKIVLGGRFTAVNGTTRNRIARLNADGSIDSSFQPGTGVDSSAVSDNFVFCMAVQADGKIVLGGRLTTVNGTGRNGIARLHADGSLESTATFNPSASVGTVILSLAVQADGKIVLVGSFSTFNGTGREHIARLNVDGSLDSTFNPRISVDSSVRSVAVQVDGKIVLGGSFNTVNGTARNGIARLHADGSLETSFNPGPGAFSALAVQADGKVVLSGEFTSFNGSERNRIARLANDPASQTLTAPDATQALWTRGGSAPEVSQVTFELSTDSGVKWTPLGTGTRVGTTANWRITGLSLPTSGQLRARGRTAGGQYNGSSGLVETVASFSGLTPVAPIVTSVSPNEGRPIGGASVTISGMGFTGASAVRFGGTAAASFSVTNSTTIAAVSPAHALGAVSVDVTTAVGTNAANTLYTYLAPPSVTASTANLPTIATTLTITGTNFSPTPGNNSIVFTPTGSGTVTASTPTSLTVTGLTGLTLGALNAVVTTSGQSSGAPVQVATVFTVAGTLEAYNPNVGGTVVYATAMQPDGKMIIGGNFRTVGGVAHANLARLHADGSVDASFTARTIGEVFSVAVQADGKIVLGGAFTSVNGTVRRRIARLHADGSLDTSFDPGTGADGGVTSVAMQADGKIVLGGLFTMFNNTARKRIARLNADGSLESTATFNPGTGVDNRVFCVAVQADGKIVLGGDFDSFNGTARRSIARLHADGSLDTSFDPGTGAGGGVNSVAVQADGKIVLGGHFTSFNGTPRNFIARLHADGSLDSTFNPGSGSNGPVNSVAAQADGKIVLGGTFTSVNGTPRNGIARLHVDGSLDTTFHPGTGANGWVTSVAVQADGKIVLGGGFDLVNGTARNYIARLANDPATQTLTAPDATQALWTRGGSAPEVSQVTFELSTDGGTVWTPIGAGTRIGTTANWQRTGLSLPSSGQLRARGRTTGGYFNGSSGLVETVASFRSQTGFAAWAANYGVAHDPTALGANGLQNLLNFAFGQSPSTRNPLSYTGNVITPGGPRAEMLVGTATAEFNRRKDHATAGLTYAAQFSADLRTWETNATPPSVLADDGTHQVVGLSFPRLSDGAQAKFFRVSVSLP